MVWVSSASCSQLHTRLPTYIVCIPIDPPRSHWKKIVCYTTDKHRYLYRPPFSVNWFSVFSIISKALY